MLKKIAIATTVSILSAWMLVNMASAQELGDGDIDSIINGLTTDSGTTTTTTNTEAPEVTVDMGEITPISMETTSSDDIMLEPDDSMETVSIEGSDGIVEDVMVEPETDTMVEAIPYTNESTSVAQPKSNKSYKRLSAAGMDLVTVLAISGLLSSMVAGYFLFRRRK